MTQNATFTYSYDNAGNITSVEQYPLNDTTGTPEVTHTYAYDDSTWGDLLTAYDGHTITHDAMGNMTSYNGSTYTWQGRQLKTIQGGGNAYSYQYNADGIRTSKTVNGTTTEYFLSGTQILAQKTGSETLWFFYDSTGQRVAVLCGGVLYYYVYNLQGDVIALAGANTGRILVKYKYDAWGKCTLTDDRTSTHVGEKNPFRYRGYYLDAETEMYYLNSRYYSPEFGRFISPDVFVSTGQGVLGSNMFAYCNNNPVMGYDPTGTWVIGIMGGSVSGGFGVGGSIGVMTIFDGKGNVAEVVIGYYGGGTPNVGASIDFLTYSSAEDIFQFVYGYSICVGGSYEFASLDVCLGSDMDGNAFAGFTISGRDAPTTCIASATLS